MRVDWVETQGIRLVLEDETALAHLHGEELVETHTVPLLVALPDQTVGGRPALFLDIELPDRHVVLVLTLGTWQMANAGIRGRYGEPPRPGGPQ